MKIKLYTPNYGQRYVIANLKKRNYIIAGRRWRKSSLAIQIAIEQAIKGKRIIFGSPIFRQARLNFQNALRCFSDDYKDFNWSNLELPITKTGIVLFRSLENYENLRGDSADIIVIDEVSNVREDAWNSVLRQMLLDTKGQSIFLGTPKGINWVHNNFQDALADKINSFAIQIPTIGCYINDKNYLVYRPSKLDNPDISFGDILKEFEETPLDVFRQEILAEFLANDALIFRYIDDLHTLEIDDPRNHIDHEIVAGVDLAKERDFTTISIGCVNCKKEIYVDRFNKIDWKLQAERIKNIFVKYNVSLANIDGTGIGSVFIPQLQEICDNDPLLYNLSINNIIFTQTSKNDLVNNMILTFDKQECEFINNPIWKKELYNFGVSNGKYIGLNGAHDDCVFGRSLMLKALKHPGLLL